MFRYSIQPYFLSIRKLISVSGGVYSSPFNSQMSLNLAIVSLSKAPTALVFISQALCKLFALVNWRVPFSESRRSAIVFSLFYLIRSVTGLLFVLRLSFLANKQLLYKGKSRVLPFKDRRPFFLIYKVTRTNSYVSLTNQQGDVLYSSSAGSLGVKKRWERHLPGTFVKVLDGCFSFIKKNKITKSFFCQVHNYNMPYIYTLSSRASAFNLKVLSYHFSPKLVHGRFLKKKRIKRL